MKVRGKKINWSKILKSILLWLNILNSTALVFAYLGTHISPNSIGFLAYGNLEEMHIISPMRENLDETNEMIKNGLLKAAIEKEKHEGILQKLEHFSINIGLKSFQEFVVALDKYNTDAPQIDNIYVSIPSMTQNTPLLDFGAQENTYNTTYDWLTGAGKNQVKVPIKTYISNHGLS